MRKKDLKKELPLYILSVIALAGVTYSVYTLFLPIPGDHTAQQTMQASPHFGPRLTTFDVELAKEFMDKDNDGKCDYCGMDVDLCIGSGQLQCNMDPSSTMGVLKSAHIHADFKLYIDGKPMDLSSHEYNVKSMFAHVEGGNGDVIHFHATGIQLGLFFKSVNVAIPQIARVIVNGKEITEKLDYVPSDKDKILITTSTDPAMIVREQSTITSFAEGTKQL